MIHYYAFLYNYSGMNRTRQFVADTLFTHARKTPVLRGEGFFFAAGQRFLLFCSQGCIFVPVPAYGDETKFNRAAWGGAA
jgi:hypothetical protein